MGRIDELKAELIQAVLDSEEYREYKRLEAEVSKNADLKGQLMNFGDGILKYSTTMKFRGLMRIFRSWKRNTLI